MGSPVTLSRATADAIAAELNRLRLSSNLPPSALAELRAALTDAAEAAAWEPFRSRLLQFRARDAAMAPKGTANLDQLVAAMRSRFEAAAMSIDDPTVIRTILVTATCADRYARDLAGRDPALVTHEEAGVVSGVAVTLQLAAARLVAPKALR